MSILPILPQGFVVGRILTSRGDSADADKKADTAVVVGMVDFTPATAYRKLDAFTAVTHSKMTAKLDSHGDLHPQRETSDNTGSDTEDGIWLPTGTWKVTYRLNTGMGALPEHQIEVTAAHTEAAPLPLFANLSAPAPAGATFVQLSVPLGGQQGQVLVMNNGSLAWGDVSVSGDAGMTTEGVQDVVGAMVAGAGGAYNDGAGTITLPGGIEQVALTSNRTYTLPASVGPNRAHSVVFTQDATGSRTVTFGSGIDATNAPIRTAANSKTIVKLYPLGGGQWRAFSDLFDTEDDSTPPPAVPISVTAVAPTWTDDAANGGGTWTNATTTGVTYTPASGTATSGQTVTVTATAKSGYVLTNPGASWAHTFPAAPAGPFTDDFNRVNSTGLGANWIDINNGTVNGASRLQIVDNAASALSSGSFHVQAVNAAFANDQYVEADVMTWGSLGSASAYLYVRADTIRKGYELGLNGVNGTWALKQHPGLASASEGTVQNPANAVTLASGTFTSAPGQRVRLEASGDTITATLGGTTLTTVTDTAHATGRPGIGVFRVGVSIDNVEAGDL